MPDQNHRGITRRASLQVFGVAAAAGVGGLAGTGRPVAASATLPIAKTWTPSTFIAGVSDAGGDLASILSRNGVLYNGIDTAPTSLKYRGEKVVLEPYEASEYSYDATKHTELTALRGQGFTTHGDVGFVFFDGGYARAVDLSTHAYIGSTFALPSGVQNASNHAGQANFGVEYVDSADEFPVLYLSSYLEKKCYVLRMTRTSAELVQTIYVTDGSLDGSSNYVLSNAQAFFPDAQNDKLVVKMGATGPDSVKYKFWYVFDMPTLDLGSTVYLFEEKACDRFFIRTLKGNVTASLNYVNGGFAMNGKLYVLAGFTGDTSRLLVIDYEKHKILTEIDWDTTLITSGEQKQCCLYGDALLINFTNKDYFVQVTAS